MSGGRRRWTIAIQAGNRGSNGIVPLYDSLGEDAVSYTAKHSGMVAIFVVADKMASLVAAGPAIRPGVRSIVYWGSPQPELASKLQALVCARSPWSGFCIFCAIPCRVFFCRCSPCSAPRVYEIEAEQRPGFLGLRQRPGCLVSVRVCALPAQRLGFQAVVRARTLTVQSLGFPGLTQSRGSALALALLSACRVFGG